MRNSSRVASLMNRCFLLVVSIALQFLQGAVPDVALPTDNVLASIENLPSKRKLCGLEAVEKKRVQKRARTLEVSENDVLEPMRKSDYDSLINIVSCIPKSLDLTVSFMMAYDQDDHKSALILAKNCFINPFANNLAWFYRALQLRSEGRELLKYYLEHHQLETFHLKTAYLALLQAICTCNSEEYEEIGKLIALVYVTKGFESLASRIAGSLKFGPKNSVMKWALPKIEAHLEKIGIIAKDKVALPEQDKIRFYLASLTGRSADNLKTLISSVGPQRFYSETIFFLPSSYFRTISENRESEALRWMSRGSLEFYKQILVELTLGPVVQVHVEERFWANCLFDNYFHLIEDKRGYEGSVEIGPKDLDVKKMLFPEFNKLFASQSQIANKHMTFEDPEERAKMEQFISYLDNVCESSERFTSSLQRIKRKLAFLNPG